MKRTKAFDGEKREREREKKRRNNFPTVINRTPPLQFLRAARIIVKKYDAFKKN